MDDPRKVLEVSSEAGDEEIRAAYLGKVKQYPPERFPEEFEQVRDAYEALRDPRARYRSFLDSVAPDAPLTSLLEQAAAEKRFLGPEPWLAVLKEKNSG